MRLRRYVECQVLVTKRHTASANLYALFIGCLGFSQTQKDRKPRAFGLFQSWVPLVTLLRRVL
ncbi:hypothetical protein PsAD14_05564 [Pseudovibrio sp. Ad14]|nr:hypothetical protein PsW74_04632 [Pseudovibrio sp. W74]KZL04499.1 hypothetical protein PsAD14_05564 [Pseudovibrio sp. Ad14]